MPDNHFRAQRSPSPKASPTVLPPLSKYYYGPAQGRASAEASPIHNASTWTVNSPHEQAPTLPPRRSSPGPPPFSPTQWADDYPSQSDPAQGWDEYVPPPPAPPAGQFIESYALMHKANRSSVNPTWDSSSPRNSMDASRWSVNYAQRVPEPPAKPPLPPRISHNLDQMHRRPSSDRRPSQGFHQSVYSSKQPASSRVSATTIDVPLFLQPMIYESDDAPPLPRRPSISQQEQQHSPKRSSQSLPQPQRLPPPPPKIPLEQDGDSESAPTAPQRPRYDPQYSLDESQPHVQSPRKAQRRPTFDPQDSLDSDTSPPERKQLHQQPKIPTPQFSSFNEASALPPPSSNGSDVVPQDGPTYPIEQHNNKDDDRFRAGQRLHQSSISPINSNHNDRWVPNHNRWEPQAAYVPPPEPQHAALPPRDGSISMTDVSSNRAGLSTPESQQTSNTSYRESVNQPDHSRQEQQDDETFYWHSGRSSSGAEDDHSQTGSTTATPGQSSVGPGSSIATTRSTVRQDSPSLQGRTNNDTTTSGTISTSATVGPYGASALGFGGPSDWEYFGDYEAEEVDDEELYSRIKAPAELPAESTDTHDASASQEEGQTGSGPRSKDRPPVPQRSPARESTSVFSPREEMNEKQDAVAGDYSAARLRISSVQSPTRLNNSWNNEDRPISYYQRPDLDDVIRAWSEAPYIGLDPSKDADSHTTDEDDGVVDRCPEASLASTPQDRFLGIDLILKDAPEMPKLPDSIDQPSPSFPSPSLEQYKFQKVASEENLRNNSSSKTAKDSAKRVSKRVEPLVERESEAKHTSVADGQASPLDPPQQRAEVDASESRTKFELGSSHLHGHLEENQNERPLAVRHTTGKTKETSLEKEKLPTLARQINDPSPTDVSTSRNDSTDIQKPDLKPAVDGKIHRVPEEKQQQRSESISMTEEIRPLSQDLRASSTEPSHESAPPLTMSPKVSKEDILVPPTVLSQRRSQENRLDPSSITSSRAKLREESEPPHPMLPIEREPASIANQDVLMSSGRAGQLSQDHVKAVPEGRTRKPVPRAPMPIKVVERSIGSSGPASPKSPTSRRASTSKASTSPKVPISPRVPTSPKAVKVIDPYSDLDPWGKASLNRFAAMLREEARVESNKDKLNIFNVFTSRESRLRVVLYGTDDELILPPTSPEATSAEQQRPQVPDEEKLDERIFTDGKADGQRLVGQQSNETTSAEEKSAEEKLAEKKAFEGKDKLDTMLAERAPAEAPPPEPHSKEQIPAEQNSAADQKPTGSQGQKKSSFVKQAIERANTIGLERSLKALPALPKNRESIAGPPGINSKPLTTQESGTSKQPVGAAGQGSQPVIDPLTDEVQYSPGGRPILPALPKESIGGQEDSVSSVADQEHSFKTIDGNAIEPESAPAPQPVPRPRPKPKEGESEVKNYLTNRRSVYRPFATQTLETMESGSNFGRESDIKIDSTPLPILRAPSSKYSAAKQAAEAENLPKVAAEPVPQVSTTEQSELRRFVQADFDPLLMVLPEGEAVICESIRLQDLKDVMETIPEDFSFIHASVVAWDATTRVQREENDRLRHERQAESEKRIDSLFDDHEIGYGDISELEAEFKRSEAARKADEDRSEYQTFVANVFDLVWTRLHYELDQLVPQYDRYSQIMDATLAGKEMFDRSDDILALAPTMTQFLALHQKIEIRHQKAFEAVLERDRRLKKTEISPWYTLSNITKVKQLEKQFEDAEKKAIIEYCEQRDKRANRLMDVLDQNTLRGVGANQDYMEGIMKAVRRIASGRAFASVPGSEGADTGLEEVKRAQTITAVLATSSEQIVQTFHVADMLLNSADYEVSVAKAKVARVDLATLSKLKEERAKEDQKLMRDLEHRLALIREDSRRTNDEIIKLMLFLGVHNGRADEASTPRALALHMRGGSLEAGHALAMQAGPSQDPEHEERIWKALEEAKRRNALKESGG